jgi:transposase InsO family protein
MASSARWGAAPTPYDNAKAESFIKTLKVEAIYPMAYETPRTYSPTECFTVSCAANSAPI